MANSKFDDWILAVEVWKSGAHVTHFMRDAIAGLRDAEGDLLPEAARKFLADLVFCKMKPRQGRPIAKSAIRESFKYRVFVEQTRDKPGPGTPTERAIASIADELKLAEDHIRKIVYHSKAHKS